MIVYLAFNRITEKVYIGKTSNFLRRRSQHLIDSRHPKASKYFSKAINKHGSENFDWFILESGLSEEDASSKERAYIKQFGSRSSTYGYNLTLGGEGTLGYTYSDESKEKMRQSALGKQISSETRRLMSIARKGQKRTKEQCATIRAAIRKVKATKVLAWRCGMSPATAVEYATVIDFCRDTGTKQNNVTKCLNGITKKINGYHLKRVA